MHRLRARARRTSCATAATSSARTRIVRDRETSRVLLPLQPLEAALVRPVNRVEQRVGEPDPLVT